MAHSYVTLISLLIVKSDLPFRMPVTLTYKTWCFTLVSILSISSFFLFDAYFFFGFSIKIKLLLIDFINLVTYLHFISFFE